MFPAPKLISIRPGQILLKEAVGKTFRIDRATAFAPAGVWTSVQTQTLTATTWLYSDLATAKTNSAFYRAVWLK